MSINELHDFFKNVFPDLEVSEYRRIGDWYVFTVSNAQTENIHGADIAIDPYLGYNIKTKEWNRLTPPMVGVDRFFKAKPTQFK